MNALLMVGSNERRMRARQILEKRGYTVHVWEQFCEDESDLPDPAPTMVVFGEATEGAFRCARVIRSNLGSQVIILFYFSTIDPPAINSALDAGADDVVVGDEEENLRLRLTVWEHQQKRAERELRESRTKAQAVLDTTVDAIITIDEQGHIESFNKAAEDIFGYRAEEVIGENVKLLMPSPYREEHDGYLQSYRETGEAKIIGIGREVVGRRSDGSTFPLQLSVSEVALGEERLFTGIVRDLSEKRRLEREILRISEQERRRIGQDLHDGLGQMLNAIAIFCETLTEQLEEQDRQLADRAEFITEKIREADEQARSLGRGLVMVNTGKDGLPGALRRLCANVEELYGVDCSLHLEGQPEINDQTVATHLYRIAQEAINNAIRHGDASDIGVTVAAGNEYLRLRIKDNGSGFPDEVDDDHQGMGIRTMNYRAHLIGGSLHIHSDPSGGATVTCTLPVVDEERMTVH